VKSKCEIIPISKRGHDSITDYCNQLEKQMSQNESTFTEQKSKDVDGREIKDNYWF